LIISHERHIEDLISFHGHSSLQQSQLASGGQSWATHATSNTSVQSSGNTVSYSHSSSSYTTTSSQSVSSSNQNYKPTQEEINDLSKALEKLWELDGNRLSPGKQFQLNLQRYTRITNGEDEAREPLFKHVDHNVFKSHPTYGSFYQLLDNYSAHNGVTENVTQEELQEQNKFINGIANTGPILYLHNYLVAKNLADADINNFKKELHRIWFEVCTYRLLNKSIFAGSAGGR
jgi:poly(U)-specific endoribonuclease